MTLGEKIRYYREIQKMGQEKLAELSHISVSAIRKYESGERIPKDSQLEKLAIALHISPVALRDIHFDSFVDLLPYLYEISKLGDISFDGEKDAEGKLIPTELRIKYNNPDFQAFFKEWADKINECEQIKTAAENINDSQTREMMLRRSSDIEVEIEQKLVTERIINNIYHEYDVPKSLYAKRSLKDFPALKTYADILTALYDLALSGTKFECVGIFERVWAAQAIITFDADFIEKKDSSVYNEKTFSSFLHYFNEFNSKYGIKTSAYTYQQGVDHYYRFIIEDRVLASAMSIINEVLNADITNMDSQNRKEFEDDIKDQISQFNIPVEQKK